MKTLSITFLLLSLAACGSGLNSYESAWNEIDYSAYKETAARAPIQNGKPVYIRSISLSGNLSTSFPSGQTQQN